MSENLVYLGQSEKRWSFRLASVLVTQSCPTLCDPIDCSPPGSSARRIFQARLLEWVAIPFPRGSSRPGIEPRSPILWADSWPSKPPGKLPCREDWLELISRFNLALWSSMELENSRRMKELVQKPLREGSFSTTLKSRNKSHCQELRTAGRTEVWAPGTAAKSTRGGVRVSGKRSHWKASSPLKWSPWLLHAEKIQKE